MDTYDVLVVSTSSKEIKSKTIFALIPQTDLRQLFLTGYHTQPFINLSQRALPLITVF